MWTLVDIQSRNPVLIQSAIDNPLMKPLEKKEDDFEFNLEDYL